MPMSERDKRRILGEPQPEPVRTSLKKAFDKEPLSLRDLERKTFRDGPRGDSINTRWTGHS